MKLSTLCYIEREGCYLMLHRVKKKQDVNAGKWIGVGGKLEEGESPDECVCREVLEETGLRLVNARMRGVITFVSDGWDDEIMFLYTGEGAGTVHPDCDEGVLRWIPFDDVPALRLWEGDRVFLNLLRESKEFFSLKLSYHGDALIHCALNGNTMTTLAPEEPK
ncbi:MAG: 8-oxo-dGTP diphosphatase [Clostridia bacterium]|nr:8-oxo-dGTP diphosphatase [Clostridia bacterium]